MRRTDRQITDSGLIHDILHNNTVCRIAFSENNIPYIVPMNYGYTNNTIYVHSAKEGRKIDIIKTNNRICIEITDSIEIIPSETACHYSTQYRSVIGFGNIISIEDRIKKNNALTIIMKQHTGKTHWIFNDIYIDNIIVYEILLESVSGKISGFDAND